MTFTATVAVASPGAGTPTGTVTFKDGTTTLGTGTLSTTGGVTTATFTTADARPLGSHSITAVYGGGTNDLASTSAALTFKVAQDATATAVVASPTATVYGQSVTFKATVSVSSPGAGTPTGTVTFKDGSTVLGTGTLSTSSGVTTATFSTTALAVGVALDHRRLRRRHRRPGQHLRGADIRFSQDATRPQSSPRRPPRCSASR